MKRFVRCRKQLTNDEARSRIANLQQAISADIDNINYWRCRIGKKLEFIDTFILGVDKIKSPEDFIKMAKESIEYKTKKIDDYKRFLTEKFKLFIY